MNHIVRCNYSNDPTLGTIFLCRPFVAETKKIPDINNLRKEGLISAHGFSPSWLGGHGREEQLTS
jgi:hypothetical protein